MLPSVMDELEESWAVMLMAASERAAMQGRADVAEYLRLKATNDAIRAAGVKWLLDAFIEIAFEQNQSAIKVERKEGHSFAHGASTMAGSQLTIRYGVRCLEIEAGWARTPSHGIMREAALARANVLHFGRGRRQREPETNARRRSSRVATAGGQKFSARGRATPCQASA